MKRLSKVREHLWTDGNLTVHYWPWCEKPWRATWTDIFNSKHTVEEFTRERMLSRLAVYGMKDIALARK